MGTPAGSPLGKAAHYEDGHDPGLLYPVERGPLRAELGIAGALPFRGVDAWTAWELSWLDANGRPEVAIGTFDVPCDSPRIVESKSVKLYLTALNNVRYPSPAAFAAVVARDLSDATGARIDVTLRPPATFRELDRRAPEGESLDSLPLAAVPGAPDPALLRARGPRVSETLHSNLFRSVCPVTGQPDYATVTIRCAGPALDREGLLAYLVSYRRHPGFHEHCVERIFVDVLRAGAPEALSVEARFTRRGGVDINPVRTTLAALPARSAPTPQQ